MQVFENNVRLLMAWASSGRLMDLVSARHHSAYLTRHRLTTIVTRTRLVAVAFSVFTLLWMGVDIATFPPEVWSVLAGCRILVVIAFVLLAVAPERAPSRVRSLTMLAALLAMPLTIYTVSQFLLTGMPLEGLAAVNGQLYKSLPLIVLAGLSIFPLVTGESALFALVVGCAVAAIQVLLVGVGVVDLFANLWVLMLAQGVYMLACAIQLHFMLALLRRASLDPMTGALTRRSGTELLDLHFGLAVDQEGPLSILFVDADNFKAINDMFGHEAGDGALKGIVSHLQAFLREADVVIRWGGEEFVVILPNTPMKGAALVVDRIVNEWFGVRPEGGPLTASLGLAERQTDGATDWAQLIALADERMYKAKTSGKACCVNHAGVMERGTPLTSAAPA